MKSSDPDNPKDSSGSSFLTMPLAEFFSTGIVLLDNRKKITAFNPDAAHLLDFKQGNAPLTSADLPEPLRQFFKAIPGSTENFHEQQIVFSADSKAERPVRAHAATIRNEKKETTGFVIVLHDLSGLTALGQNMHRLDRLATVGTLSASMAHEIKNALVPVKTFLDLLLEKNQDEELGKIVSRAMDRIDAIVSQMLKFGGRAKPEFISTNVHGLLDHALRLIQHQLDTKRIKVQRAFKATTDTVRGDAYQLEQAFINLFFNALEAMRPHGELSIATEIATVESESRLQIQIHDTGGGISAANLAQLFEPFFTTKPEGTGLGLTITRRIIHEHRGTISVESELGKGTTFQIRFPVSTGEI